MRCSSQKPASATSAAALPWKCFIPEWHLRSAIPNLVSIDVDNLPSKGEVVVFSAGSHTDTMSLTYDDFERLAKPDVADLAVRS
jgi:hypothetical protein